AGLRQLGHLDIQRIRRRPAVRSALAAHLRAAAAVRVVVFGAFGLTDLASADARLEDRADQLDVAPGSPRRDTVGRFAHVRAVEAGADALPHVRFFGRAGVGAGIADRRAVHRVPYCEAERLVVGAARGDVGVLLDHPFDRHGRSPAHHRSACGRSWFPVTPTIPTAPAILTGGNARSKRKRAAPTGAALHFPVQGKIVRTALRSARRPAGYFRHSAPWAGRAWS